jgi:hypothetical protein
MAAICFPLGTPLQRYHQGKIIILNYQWIIRSVECQTQQQFPLPAFLG